MTAISEARSLRENVIIPSADINRVKTRDYTFEHWPIYGRDFSSYLNDFYRVIDSRELLDYLDRLKRPVVIDFFSGPEALIGLFANLRGLDHLGISVGLADMRDSRDRKRDEARNIHHISGDILETKTWTSVRRMLGGQKADLVIEAAVGAIADDKKRTIPLNRAFFGLVLNRAWGLLSENNGTLLCEIPNAPTLSRADIDFPKWKQMLGQSQIDFADDVDRYTGFIRLTKTPGSPNRLPLLP